MDERAYLSHVRTLTFDVELLITSNLNGWVFVRNVQSMSAATVASSTDARAIVSIGWLLCLVDLRGDEN